VVLPVDIGRGATHKKGTLRWLGQNPVIRHGWLHGVPTFSSFGGIKAMSSKKSKIRPLQDRIIVERLAPEEKSSGGIILPDNAQERPQRGRVVAVGKGKVREDGTVTPVDVKEGDEILFGKYSGTEVKVEGSDLLIMREDDVLGVVL
jgi:chaperonin GroES